MGGEEARALSPKRLPSPCSWPGCPEVTTERYCDTHRKANYKDQDQRRGSYRERGYSTQWDKVRKIYTRSHPLCERCLARGVARPVAIVHHKVPVAEGGAVLDMGNLMSLCHSCHAKEHNKR